MIYKPDAKNNHQDCLPFAYDQLRASGKWRQCFSIEYIGQKVVFTEQKTQKQVLIWNLIWNEYEQISLEYKIINRL